MRKAQIKYSTRLCASTLILFRCRRQVFDKGQFGAGMQLSKVYLIHEGADKEDAAPSAAQKVFRGQRVGKGVRIEALALVSNGDDECGAGVLKGGGDFFGGVVLVAMEHGIDGGFAGGHGYMEALVLVQTGLTGQLFRGSFNLADA